MQTAGKRQIQKLLKFPEREGTDIHFVLAVNPDLRVSFWKNTFIHSRSSVKSSFQQLSLIPMIASCNRMAIFDEDFS